MPDRSMTIDSANLTPAGKFRLLTLSALDQRTIAARRAKSQIEALEADLGGAQNLNVRERMLIRDVAFLDVFIEDNAAKYIGGKRINVSDWTIAIGARRRILQMFGLEGGPCPEDAAPQPPAEEPDTIIQRAVEKVIADSEDAAT